MMSFREIETTTNRASKAAGFSWGVAEEMGKNIRLLEMFGLPGLKNINQYYRIYKISNFEDIKEISILKPAVLIVLAYLHLKKIIKKNKKYLINNGKFLSLYPKVELISLKNYKKFI